MSNPSNDFFFFYFSQHTSLAESQFELTIALEVDIVWGPLYSTGLADQVLTHEANVYIGLFDYLAVYCAVA